MKPRAKAISTHVYIYTAAQRSGASPFSRPPEAGKIKYSEVVKTSAPQYFSLRRNLYLTPIVTGFHRATQRSRMNIGGIIFRVVFI